jgi:hypothetical protein
MSWLWWLLAPGAAVSLVLALQGVHDRAMARREDRDPIVAHRALLQALDSVPIPRAGDARPRRGDAIPPAGEPANSTRPAGTNSAGG